MASEKETVFLARFGPIGRGRRNCSMLRRYLQLQSKPPRYLQLSQGGHALARRSLAGRRTLR